MRYPVPAYDRLGRYVPSVPTRKPDEPRLAGAAAELAFTGAIGG